MFTQPNSLGVLEVGTCGYERRVLVQLRKRWAKFSNVNLRLRRVSLRKASIKAQNRLSGDLVNSNHWHVGRCAHWKDSVVRDDLSQASGWCSYR